MSPFVIFEVSGLFCRFNSFFFFGRKILLANNVDPDQTPHNVASDRGLHCLPITCLRGSRQESVKPKAIANFGA